MVCLGLEPGAAGWKAQTNPLSYGGTPGKHFLFDRTIMIKILTFSLPTQNMLLKLVYLVSTMP